MTDDIVEGQVLEDLPFGGSLFGHCQDAKDQTGISDPREVARLHRGCPGTLWPTPHRDPARKGTYYQLPGRRCPCVCHTRPATLSAGATEGTQHG